MRSLSFPAFSFPLLPVLAVCHALNLVACQAASNSSSAACTSSSSSADCAAQGGETLTLTSRRPLAIKAGDTVALTGTGFSEAMTATVGGIPATSLSVSSATSASLVVPAGVTPGMADLKLSLSGTGNGSASGSASGSEVTASMAYMPTGDIPLITLAVSEVCSGVEYYDINGDRQTGTKSCSSSSSSSSPDPWDLRAGTTVGGVTGKLKANCRNAISDGAFNYDGDVASIGRVGKYEGTSRDVWDTVGDYLIDDEYSYPHDQPLAWVNNLCGNNIDDSEDEANVWKDVTTTSGSTTAPCDATSDECRFKDRISGLQWTSAQPFPSAGYFYWDEAVLACANLTWNGITGWRLPTQKELMEAYIHGIGSAAIANDTWLSLDFQNAYAVAPFWSATTRVGYNNDGDPLGNYAFYVSLREGIVGRVVKANQSTFGVLCVK